MFFYIYFPYLYGTREGRPPVICSPNAYLNKRAATACK